MLCFVTDCRPGESDILDAVRMEPLKLADLQGRLIASHVAPAGGWTHEALQRVAAALESQCAAGAEAYIGEQWVGGTEV